jgi:predicted aspartyl protease
MAMFKKYLALLLPLLSLLSVRAQQGSNDGIKAQLKQYLDQSDFFRLESVYRQTKSQLSPGDQLYFQAIIDNVFNRCQASAEAINRLLASYGKNITDSEYVNILDCRMDNYFKTYDYRLSAETGEKLITGYSKAMSADQLATYKNSASLCKSMAAIPKQTTIRKTSRIEWKRDKVGLMTIPVTVNGQTHSFVFDTGANFSTISKSFADSLHLTILPADFDLGTGTSIRTKSSIAVAKKLLIGNIEVQNAVFLVLPDDQLSFPQLQYSINAILGFPVISQLGEIHILQSGTMVIPEKPTFEDLHNVILEGFNPVIALRTDEDTLGYHFDTGAKVSILYKKYFDKYQAEITEHGKEDSASLGSAGGVVRLRVFKLPEFTFYTGDKKVVLHDIDVLTTKNGEGDLPYGTIGQDFVSQFNEMVINFSPLYIGFR